MTGKIKCHYHHHHYHHLITKVSIFMLFGSFGLFFFSAKGRTNVELREKFILPEGTTQVMASFRYRGRRSRPSSRGASPNRSTSSQSCLIPVNQATTNTAKVREIPASLQISAALSSNPSLFWSHVPDSVKFIILLIIFLLFFFLHLVFHVVFDLWIHVFWFAVVPQTPQHITRNYDKPWLTNSKPSTPLKSSESFESQGSSSEV